MDFTYDNEQTALRDAVRGLLSTSFDLREKLVEAEPGYDTGMWSKLAEMGLLGLPFAEEHDGMDAGPVEVSIVAQEIGRVLEPAPFVDVVVIAGGLIQDAGTDEQKADLLPRIATGDLTVVLAHAEPRAPFGTAAYAVTAEQGGDTWTLSGTKEPVTHGASADLLLVTARVDEETRVFVVDPAQDAVTRTGYATHEGSRAARIVLDGAAATPLGEAGAPALAAAFVRGQVALSAEALGAMEQSLTTTVEYLKTRKQFGVPLAKFQALTHRAADMYVSLELARSTVQYATMALATGPDPVPAARAKIQVGRSGRHIGQEAIQLHGGIGMTDEYSIGHYTSRLVAIEHTLGSSTEHLATLSEGVADHGLVELLH